MKTKKEFLKENGLTNIDELMDSQFGKPGTPERERFREEARTYVNGHAKTAECRNSQKKQKYPAFPVRSGEPKHYLRSVKFFSDVDGKRWLFEKYALSSPMYLVEY